VESGRSEPAGRRKPPPPNHRQSARFDAASQDAKRSSGTASAGLNWTR